ncbi:MAG: tetratricopeptide repeat protein [Candidatus Hydrogenedens sp.]|nr:tetratricopeptide repeat protein [Candidatus Hydrogenedens sp.]
MEEQDTQEPILDFIVSYKDSEAPWAEAVAHVLRAVGYQVELRPWAYTASKPFLEEVKQRGEQGTCLVPILTPAYMTTVHAEHYWFEAFKRGYFPVLPVWGHECEIDNLLFVHEYVDLRDSNIDRARPALLDMARELRGEPSGPAEIATPVPVAERKQAVRIEDLVPVRRIPFERAECYTASGNLLEELQDCIQRHHIAVLFGHPAGELGYGRRKTCIEFLYRYAESYPIIWVVRAHHPAVLAEDYAKLAQVIKLPEAGARDLAYTVQAVRRWLSANPRWLLVFNEPPDYESVQQYLPFSPIGHVLIAAESGEWLKVPHHFHIRGWSRAEAAQYLLRRTAQSEEKFAEEIASQLDYCPLSLSLASAYINQQHVSLDEYAVRLRDRLKLLHESGGKGRSGLMIEAALSLNVGALGDAMPDALSFMKGFAYLHSYNIVPGAFVEGANALPKSMAKVVQRPKSVEAAVKLMRSWGLLEEQYGSIAVHTRIRATLRKWLEAGPSHVIHEAIPALTPSQSFSLARAEGPDWVKRMLKLLLAAFPDENKDAAAWPQTGRLLPHALELLSHAQRLGVAKDDQAELWRRIGEYLMHRELLALAREAFEHSRAADEHTLITGSKRRLSVLCGLGQTLTYSGDYQAARECLEEARKLASGPLGKGSSELSEVYVLLGNAYRRGGDTDGSLAYYDKALEIDKRLHGDAHEDVLRDYILLGITRQQQGDLSGAWRSFESALSIQQSIFGPEHISLARVSKCLGQVFHAMGDTLKAQAYLRRAIDVTRAIHGLGHPSVAEAYEEYGDVLMTSHDIPGARRAYKQAFRTLEAVYGPDDPRVAEIAMKLGDTANALQLNDKARAAYERAFFIYERRFGLEDGRTRKARAALAGGPA